MKSNPMLQRIYGTVWETPEELQDTCTLLEEAKKRDHRKLGRSWICSAAVDEIGAG